MQGNPLLGRKELGQSVWLDGLRRGWLQDGTLARRVHEDGFAGVTSTTASFAKARRDGEVEEGASSAMEAADASAKAIFHALILEDNGGDVNLFLPLYDASGGRTGFLSLDVT